MAYDNIKSNKKPELHLFFEKHIFGKTTTGDGGGGGEGGNWTPPLPHPAVFSGLRSKFLRLKVKVDEKEFFFLVKKKVFSCFNSCFTRTVSTSLVASFLPNFFQFLLLFFHFYSSIQGKRLILTHFGTVSPFWREY